MPKTRQPKKLTAQERRVQEWIRDNWGILTRIAVKLECCHQFVQQVAYGKSTTYKAHLVVEAELRANGWPGIIRPGYKDLRVNRGF